MATEQIPGVAEYAAALTVAQRRSVLRPVAEWLLAVGYPVDWSTVHAPPADLWEAIVDVVHERDGAEVARDEVDGWLRLETTGPGDEEEA